MWIMFSGHHGLQLFGLVLVCLVTVSSSAMAQSCPQEPPNHVLLQDRTLVVMVFNRSDQTWAPFEVAPGKPPSVAFNQSKLCFFYAVKSDQLRVGALVILVTRRFSKQAQYSEWVFLNRGDGFFYQNGSSKEEWRGRRTLRFYNLFHDENRPDPGFRDLFHGYWRCQDNSSSTVHPQSRLGAFTYFGDQSNSVLRRTYLLHYNTSSESEGSWIPFEVETAGQPQFLKEVSLRVWDFGASTDTPVFTGSVTR